MSEPIRWTRIALDARVDALQEKHSGRELIDAIVDFATSLTDEDRRLLQDVLLDRARKEATLELGRAHSRIRRPR